jgi:hypothetical protein
MLNLNFSLNNESMTNLFEVINNKMHQAGYSYSSAVSVVDSEGKVTTGHTNGAIWVYVNPNTQYVYTINTMDKVYTKRYLHGALNPVRGSIFDVLKDSNI